MCEYDRTDHILATDLSLDLDNKKQSDYSQAFGALREYEQFMPWVFEREPVLVVLRDS
jgi:hypothetical protein